MVPYTSVINLLFYVLSIVFLCILIPLLVYLREYGGSKVLMMFLGFFAGIPAFWSLSRTCPYPSTRHLLILSNIICIIAALFFGLLIIINKIKGNKLIPFTTRKAHSWIMETLGGYYLITGPDGQILTCNKTVLTPLLPYHDETLISFLRRSSVVSTDTAENREALESLYSEVLENNDSDGNIAISGHYYHWVYRCLGEHDLQGYLLFLTDLTDEQMLIKQHEETGRLLNLRNSWLRKQGRTAISLERSRLIEELSQKATKIITSLLITLTDDLHHLTETDFPRPIEINQALIKSRKVMTQIRSAVHTLPYRKGKEIL